MDIDTRPGGDSEPDDRARAVEAQMTDDERFSLLIGIMGELPGLGLGRDERIPDGTTMSAAYTPGVPRLGVPPLLMSDASMGVTNPGFAGRDGDTATAMPAAVALGATFNPSLAQQSGQAIAREARSRGFNVLLAGGINLARDPRNGRTYEYLSEDPWHTAVIGAATVAGIQGEGVISTLKHFTLNCNETNRHWLDARVDPDAHRESDLLAFEIAIERSQPGAVMGAYNKVNGEYACGNRTLLQDILKDDWGFPGWVMSDWGATLGWEFALNGLDQECGAQIDKILWGAEAFTDRMRTAHTEGAFPAERLSEMVQRILRSIFAVGVDSWAGKPANTVDLPAHNAISLETARQGIVLLKNDGILPLDPISAKRVAVIGGHAQVGVPTGVGSGAVVPPGGWAEVIQIGGPGMLGGARNLYLLPSSPIDELRKLLPDAQVEVDPGMFPAEAALLARRCDVAIVFGIRVEGEGFDNADLSLPWGQDAVIDAVTQANPNTVVVLETGNPVAMPWLDGTRAVIEAWYPGQAGGQAIAEVLTGVVNPSGRLPLTFPADLAQTPRPVLECLGAPWGEPVTIDYDEGSDVGYRWFAQQGHTPLFAFGHGLSYTDFEYRDLVITAESVPAESAPTDAAIAATFTVANTGSRRGADVPQLYLTHAGDSVRQRLVGFERVELDPGESRQLTLTIDPRLIATYDGSAKSARGMGQWRIDEGEHRFALARSATEPVLDAVVAISHRRWDPRS